MKLNVNSIGKKVITTETNTKKLGFSEKSQLLMFKLFSKNTYSNPIGSIVREITSNCFDSHKEAGVEKDVVIRINEPNEHMSTTGSISFIDFGVGLSPERIDTIYAKYFESTKRDSNDQIGGFGIGSKVPFSYSNVFYVITTYDKIKYHYIMTMTDEGPSINLVDQSETEDENGTEVCVPFINANDKFRFISEIVNQLAYFDKITYQNCNINNDYFIYQGKTFLYKPQDSPFNQVHVVLGKVAYPLDFRTLGLYGENYISPIAIKFDIGEIEVSMSRESLDYSPESILIIKNKLSKAMAELAEIREKQYSNITDFDFYLKVRNNSEQIKVGDNVYLELPQASIKSDFEVNFEELTGLGIKIPHNIFFYKSVELIKENKGRIKDLKSNSLEEILNFYNVYNLDCELDRNVSLYLRDTEGDLYLVKNSKFLDSSASAYDLVKSNLYTYSSVRANWKESLSTYIKFIDNYIERKFKVKNLSSVTVPDEWIEERKRQQKERRSERKDSIVNIKITFAGNLTEMDVTSKELYDTKATIIYGYREDKEKLYMADRFLGTGGFNRGVSYEKTDNRILRRSSLPVIQIRKADEKAFKAYKKAIHINEFVKKMGKKYFHILKKVLVYNEISKSGLKSHKSFVHTKFGQKLFPKEYETFVKLKSLSIGGDHIFQDFNELNSLFIESEKDFALAIKKQIESIKEANEKFYEATKFFNTDYIEDKEFVEKLLPIAKQLIK